MGKESIGIEVKSKIKSLENEIKEKDKKIFEYGKGIENFKGLYSSLKEKNKKLKIFLKENREEKTKILNLNAKHSKTASSLESIIEELNWKNGQLLSEIKLIKEKESQLIGENHELMEENKDLTVKYENYRKTLSLKENELKGYEEYFKTLKDQHDIAKFQVAAIKTESKEPSSNILEENLENSSSLNIDIIQTNELMNSQIATLTTEIKQLQRLNSQLSENLSCKSVEFELLVHNLHKIEQEFELYKNENSLNIEQIKIISKSKEKLAFENLANIKEISLLGSYID